MGDVPWVTTLGRVADAFKTSASLMQISDRAISNRSVQNHGYSLEFAAKYYASESFAKDPRVPFYMSVKPGTIYYDNMLYDVEEMDKNPWVRQSCDVLKAKYQMGAVVEMPHDQIGYLTVLGSEKEGHATEDEIASFQRLAPHVKQAYTLGHILEHRMATQTALLEALAGKVDGIMMLGRTGVPTFMNDTARYILATNDGLTFSAKQLSTSRGPETRRLHEMITNAIASSNGAIVKPGGQMLITRPSGKRPYVARVLPAPPVERFLAVEATACVIHLHDLAAEHVPSKNALCEVFGLTEREADLAIEVVRCASLANAAANASMALNTARNHLQSIFRKCGTTTQTEMVQLFSHL